MAWQQLHLQCEKMQVEMAEALLMLADAVSIVLTDAQDQPLFEPLPGESPLWDEVVVTGIFALETTDHEPARQSTYFETLANDIASKTQASRVWLSQVADKDWEREWMQHYHPIECANNLWIVPEWLEPPNAEATNIIMDPGLAFGTGYHATTRLCLDWLTEQDLTNKVVIDYGCGSGILGIAALLLGAKQVYAVDIDPQAVLATQQNAQRNQVDEKLMAFLPDDFKKFYETQQSDDNHQPVIDVLVANILAKPLMTLASYFASLLNTQGKIVLSGIIESQMQDVQAVYCQYFELDTVFGYRSQEDSHWQRLSGRLV